MKKHYITIEEKKKKEIATYLEFCTRPKKTEDRFVKTSHYMLTHKKYISLSIYSKTLLTYMKDWAAGCDEFWKTGIFEFSTTMMENIGVMCRSATVKALAQLRKFGFINAEGKNGAGAINRWSFSNRWYTGEPEPEPNTEKYKSIKNSKKYKERDKW